MRLPNTAHTSRPWLIHELTRDFRLEDVWRILRRDPRVTADWVSSSFQRHPAAGDPHSFQTETMKTTTTLLDEVLPEFVVDVFSGWLRRDFLHRIARIAEGST
jgi:hypothetical protein